MTLHSEGVHCLTSSPLSYLRRRCGQWIRTLVTHNSASTSPILSCINEKCEDLVSDESNLSGENSQYIATEPTFSCSLNTSLSYSAPHSKENMPVTKTTAMHVLRHSLLFSLLYVSLLSYRCIFFSAATSSFCTCTSFSPHLHPDI